MGMLRVISHHGDDRVLWDAARVAVGDAEAQEAVREAERIFQQQRERGATAIKTEKHQPPVRISEFDPEAEQIVMIPRVVGG
jgi:hypothetical protein